MPDRRASYVVDLAGRALRVETSAAAARALRRRATPLYVQLELYFSCLLRFKVRFFEQALDEQAVAASDKLYVSFRPVMTAQCGRDYQGSEPPVTDFPIRNANAFVPRHLFIDYKGGHWYGEFDYG